MAHAMLQGQDTNFDITKWRETYHGFIDGRTATLELRFRSNANSGCVDQKAKKISNSWIHVILRDTEGNIIWKRCISTLGNDIPMGRTWENLELLNTTKGKIENVGSFYVHTWYNERYQRMFIRDGRSL